MQVIRNFTAALDGQVIFVMVGNIFGIGTCLYKLVKKLFLKYLQGRLSLISPWARETDITYL